jgi:hypothetical protein
MNDDAEKEALAVRAAAARAAFERARRMRNYAIAGLLLFLVVLFFVMTIVRMGGHVAD